MARIFHETGRWPVWQFIDRFLDRAGQTGSEVIEDLPDDIMQRPTRLTPESEMRLTVAGLDATANGRPEVSLFLDVLTWCVNRERDAALGPPHQAASLVVTSDEYGADSERLGKPVDVVTLRKAYLLLSVEGLSGSGGFDLDAGQWSTVVNERIRPFRGVATLGDYQRVRTALDSERSAERGSPAMPSALPAATAIPDNSGPSVDPTRVFVVHGRNGQARDAMFEFLRALRLHPIEWSQAIRLTGKGSPYIGEILDVAFARAQAVVILMTPDEIAYLRPEYASGEGDPESQPAAQARPNVLFEAGMAMSRNSARAILVEFGTVRAFSDVAGRHALRLDDSAAKRKELAQRLETAGCLVDMTGDDWLTAGHLEPPPPPGGGLPLGKRVPTTTARSKIKLDVRYHNRPNSGRLEIINTGTEVVYDVDLEFPPDVQHLHLITGDLPLAKLPPGKSAKLIAVKTMGPGRDHFEVRVRGRTADGEPVSEDVFLSLLD